MREISWVQRVVQSRYNQQHGNQQLPPKIPKSRLPPPIFHSTLFKNKNSKPKSKPLNHFPLINQKRNKTRKKKNVYQYRTNHHLITRSHHVVFCFLLKVILLPNPFVFSPTTLTLSLSVPKPINSIWNFVPLILLVTLLFPPSFLPITLPVPAQATLKSLPALRDLLKPSSSVPHSGLGLHHGCSLLSRILFGCDMRDGRCAFFVFSGGVGGASGMVGDVVASIGISPVGLR